MKIKKSRNLFYEKDGYMVGITQNGVKFFFDLIDYQKVKDFTWHIDGDGYVSSKVNGKFVQFHRYILNPPREMQVDHINHCKTNNRRNNLRLATQSQNQFNALTHKNKKYSRYKGVSYFFRTRKYKASICLNGKSHYLGSFETEVEAATAYDRKAKELFGEYALINSKEVI